MDTAETRMYKALYADEPHLVTGLSAWTIYVYNSIIVNTIQYSTIQYSTVQYNTVQYSTVQYSTIQYNTIYGTYALYMVNM